MIPGFSAVPLMTHLFVAGLERMWASAGLLENPLNARTLAFLHRHQVHVVAFMWGLFLLG